jgi:CheY-like chemotaxis protein
MAEPGAATILVVEADLVWRETLRILLEDDNYRVLTAATGREALELIQTEHPHLITLEPDLPDVDGQELIERIESMDPLFDAPIIVVSERLYRPRADDHVAAVLSKPVDATLLTRSVQAALLQSSAGMLGWVRARASFRRAGHSIGQPVGVVTGDQHRSLHAESPQAA